MDISPKNAYSALGYAMEGMGIFWGGLLTSGVIYSIAANEDLLLEKIVPVAILSGLSYYVGNTIHNGIHRRDLEKRKVSALEKIAKEVESSSASN